METVLTLVRSEGAWDAASAVLSLLWPLWCVLISALLRGLRDYVQGVR